MQNPDRFPNDVAALATEYELCLAEKGVVAFDIANHKCKVLNKDLLPISLRRTEEGFMYSALCDWLSRRALPISRKNYDAIIKSAGLSGNTDILTIITRFNALSLVDNYWTRPLGTDLKYSEVNLHHHHFADLSPVSLFGDKPMAITGIPPDINQRGCMSKCFSREDVRIIIYKYSVYPEKIYAEVFAGKIAQACGFDTVVYSTAEKRDKLCSVCELGSTVDISWITASEVSISGANPKELALRLSPQRFYQMLFFDYVTGNIDRHNENWSFEMNNSGAILGLTPLYDFDNCFIAGDEDFSRVTLRPMIKEADAALCNLQDSTKVVQVLTEFLQNEIENDDSRFAGLAQYSLVRLQGL